MENKNVLIIAGLAYIILYILCYPSFYTSTDEQSYLQTAYLLREGKLTIDDPFYLIPNIQGFFRPYGFIFNGETYISKYPIGHSIILLPFTFFGWKAPFLAGLIIHLLGGVVFYKILKKIGFDTKYVLLYLFFPTLVWFSPTLYNEKSVMLFFLLGFYYYISKGEKYGLLSGLSFGLAFLVRNTSMIGFLPFVFISFFRNRRKFFYMALGFLPPLIGVMAYNTVFFGDPFTTGYSFITRYSESGQVALSILSFAPYDILYSSLSIIIALLILYPLMFFSPFLYRGKGRLEIISATLGYILFYSLSTQLYGGYKPMDVIVNMRHFVPVLPFLVITYIPMYKKLIGALRLPRATYPICISMLIIISVLFLNLQHNLLDVQKQVSDDIYANTEDQALIIGNIMASKYLLEPLGDRRFYMGDSRFIIAKVESETRLRGDLLPALTISPTNQISNTTENMSLYIDDRTYIVYRHPKERKSGRKTETDRRMERMERIIYMYPTALVYSRDYEVNLPYASSRAFTLDIYRVGE